MPDDQFDSIDAIEKHFGKLRKAAEKEEGAEDKVRAIAIDEKEAKADFRERAAAARELKAHRDSAIAAAGIPDDFHEFVTGSSPDEIDASVAKIKERVDKIRGQQDAGDDAARKFYGNPIGNGGGSPPPPRTTEDEQWLADFQGRFEGEGTGQVTVAEINKFARVLGGNHLARELARNSQAFRRAGITPEIVEQVQNGTLKQQRPARAGVSVPPRG